MEKQILKPIKRFKRRDLNGIVRLHGGCRGARSSLNHGRRRRERAEFE